MTGKVFTQKYKNCYDANIVKMIKDYNECLGSKSFVVIPIYDKSGVEYVSIEDYILIYSDDWFLLKKDYGDFILVGALYIKPESRRCGIASKLLKALAKSYNKVFIMIHPELEDAILWVKSIRAKENISPYNQFKEYVLKKCK